MDPLTIGALLGLGKSILVDAPKERRQRELTAKTQELSPWTGLKGGPIEEADPFGSALKYGATGYAMDEDSADKAFKKEMAKKMAGVFSTPDNPYTQLGQLTMPPIADSYANQYLNRVGPRLLGGE